MNSCQEFVLGRESQVKRGMQEEEERKEEEGKEEEEEEGGEIGNYLEELPRPAVTGLSAKTPQSAEETKSLCGSALEAACILSQVYSGCTNVCSFHSRTGHFIHSVPWPCWAHCRAKVLLPCWFVDAAQSKSFLGVSAGRGRGLGVTQKLWVWGAFGRR